MDFLTSASALEVRLYLPDLYADFQFLLAESVFFDKQGPWEEFARLLNRISVNLEYLSRFEVGALLRDIHALSKYYQRVFAA